MGQAYALLKLYMTVRKMCKGTHKLVSHWFVTRAVAQERQGESLLTHDFVKKKKKNVDFIKSQ